MHHLFDAHEGEAVDADIQRRWQIIQIARTFRTLPSVVRDALHHDEEQLDLDAPLLVNYAEAYDANKQATDKDDLKAWKDSRIMDLVQQHETDIRHGRAYPEGCDVAGCKKCIRNRG